VQNIKIELKLRKIGTMPKGSENHIF